MIHSNLKGIDKIGCLCVSKTMLIPYPKTYCPLVVFVAHPPQFQKFDCYKCCRAHSDLTLKSYSYLSQPKIRRPNYLLKRYLSAICWLSLKRKQLNKLNLVFIKFGLKNSRKFKNNIIRY